MKHDRHTTSHKVSKVMKIGVCSEKLETSQRRPVYRSGEDGSKALGLAQRKHQPLRASWAVLFWLPFILYHGGKTEAA